MGEDQATVIARHVELWRERLWWGVTLAACAGVVAGYVIAKVFG